MKKLRQCADDAVRLDDLSQEHRRVGKAIAAEFETLPPVRCRHLTGGVGRINS